MNDTRLQLILDDIDAAVQNRRAADAAMDDARTKLADIAEEGTGSPLLSACIRTASERLSKTLHRRDFDRFNSARSAIAHALENC